MEGYAKYDVQKGKLSIDEFYGLNILRSREMGEMPETENLSGGQFPNLYQRKSREGVELPEGVSNIRKIFRADGKLCIIADGALYFDGEKVCDGISDEGEKSVAVVNGVICIMPDKVFYDYINKNVIRATEKVIFASWKYMPSYPGRRFKCDEDRFYYYDGDNDYYEHMFYKYIKEDVGKTMVFFDEYENELCRGVIKEVRDDRVLFDDYITDVVKEVSSARVVGRDEFFVFDIEVEDGSENEVDFMQFSAPCENTVKEEKFAYLRKRLLLAECCEKFEFGHYTVSVKQGLSAEEVSYDFGNVIEEFDSDNDRCIYKVMMPGVKDQIGYNQSLNLTSISVHLPNIDYCVERDNRLFGVCSDENTIVASKLGNPYAFYSFDGTSLDSYSVNVGSEGDFTGISVCGGNVILFKERYIHILSGAKPSLFQLTGIEAYGVGKGCADSIASIDGVLYYKALRGVYRFSGSYPACISHSVGALPCSEACGADDGRTYYLLIKQSDGRVALYTYDTYYGFWHREEGGSLRSMCEIGGDIYIAGESSLLRVSENENEVFSWSALFGPFDLGLSEKKYIYSVSCRLRLSPGASVDIYASFDDGDFEMLRNISYEHTRAVTFDIPLRRCDEFSLKISGVGYCRIIGLSFSLRGGAV